MNGAYEPETRREPSAEASRGEGWILFAGVMLMLAGILNAVWGIAAIDDSTYFNGDNRFVIFDSLNTWGWFLLLAGILQLIAAFSVWSRHAYGQVAGIFFASLNAMLLLFTVNVFPFAAFMLFLVDLLVIYGLAVYGGRQRA